jgi:peroxiredoxin
MKLKEGNLAVDFTAKDIHGNEIKLSDFKGKKIVLSFLRNVSCPFCNVRVHRLMGNSVRLQHSGVQMILFFESSPDKLLKSVLHQGISPFPLIGDPEKEVYKKYGVENSIVKMMKTFFQADVKGTMNLAKTLDTPKEKDKDASNTLIPADFFIDENFKIVKAHYGKNLEDHIDIEELKKFAGIQY